MCRDRPEQKFVLFFMAMELIKVLSACILISGASSAQNVSAESRQTIPAKPALIYYCQVPYEETLMEPWMQSTTTGQRKLIHQYYEKAFELYKKERYTRAIEYWDRILQLDPEQEAAKSLKEEARKKLIKKNIKNETAIYSHISYGRYQKALDELNIPLASDPSNSEYLKLQKRLVRIKKITPSVTYNSRPWPIFRLGVSAYIGKDKNLKLAYNALRYARELAPKSDTTKKVLAMFESEYPQVAESEKITSGMTLLEFKRFVALNYIYDDKYHLAVLTCNEILALEPNDIIALKRLGSAYYALGYKTRAMKAWKKALKFAPNDKQLKKFLGIK